MSIYDDVARRARLGAKYALKSLLYSNPPIGLQPERLMTWLQTLAATMSVDGVVLEIGCNLGGTAAVSAGLLRRLGCTKAYICVDTFSGFVKEQFEKDVALGNSRVNRHVFSCNSKALARWVLDRHGASSVQLVEGDVCELAAGTIPSPVAACLIDVDLAEPVKAALEKIYPLLSPGGIILVDDCPQEYTWQARRGYELFMQHQGLQTKYERGMGIVVKGHVTAWADCLTSATPGNPGQASNAG